jgi:hypothetical protein
MSNRRVYVPGRDVGWSNGKYWSPKRRDAHEEDHDLYETFCKTCSQIAPHQWDECLVCGPNKKEKPPEKTPRDESLESFGRDIADV